jgi:hypothetical protein
MGLDLNGMVPDLVDLGFDLAEDVVFAATYTHTTAGGYDPATGTLTPTTETASPGVILQNYTAKEIDGTQVRQGDRKAVIKAAELSAITAIALDDTILAQSQTWQVKDFILDPTGTVYQMQLRRVEG